MSQHKALSTDLIPDDCFPKEKLLEFALEDKKLLFQGPKLDLMFKTRGILLSKTGSKVANPDKTRLLSVSGIATKIFDRTVHNMVKDELWKNIGKYQKGFRKGNCTFNNIITLL